MAVLKPGYLNDVELLKCRLEFFDIGKVGCNVGVSGLVSEQELVDYQLGVGSNFKLLDSHVFDE